MRWTKPLTAELMPLAFVGLMGGAGLAGDVKTGDTVHVKPMSIWFEEREQLAAWQAVKQKGEGKALEDYEKNVLAEREAWQFVNPLEATVLGHEPKRHEVKVRLLSEGRLKDSIWFVDDSTIGP